MFDSAYDFGNYLTLGAFDTVKGAVSPEEPLSLDHWIDSAETAIFCIPFARGASSILSRFGNNRVFWYGGEIAERAAREYAKQIGGKKLEDTLRGKVCNLLTEKFGYDRTRPLWEIASKSFASGASGNVTLFINPDKYNSLTGIYSTIEKGILEKNAFIGGKIDNIFVHFTR